ncbi:MAG: TIGR02996 domain-containing protein [Alphaproteobacteria bacterium]|nr:TIGR02996 domain-containing protein [Alphaproteobacteria bacterium]
MCDVTEGFKLCTCDPDTLVEADWALQRHDRGRPVHTRRGRAARASWTERDHLQIDAVLAALDAGTAFDFDYTAEVGDVLVLRDVGSTVLRFRRGTERWHHDTSNSFAAWRSQMVTTRTGRLDLSLDRPDADEEERLLAAIAATPDDEGCRRVAEDWLRENGRETLADWLRMERETHAGTRVPGFRAVAEKLGARLRARLARAPLRGCRRSGCPGDWSALEPGPDERFRTCATCTARVRFHDGVPRYEAEPHALAPSVEG